MAMGVLVADRIGGVDGLLRRADRRDGGRTRRRHREDGWRGDERRSQPFDALPDDHSELAPEAIAHMHLHERLAERPRSESTRGQLRDRMRERRLDRQRERERRRAERHAEEIAGTPVTLEGSPQHAASPTARTPSADELESRVLEVFRNDPVLAERAIDIGAVGPGVVELTGWVDDAAEVSHALTVARGVIDVADVRNGLVARQPRVRR
jgi:hypothetical protein